LNGAKNKLTVLSVGYHVSIPIYQNSVENEDRIREYLGCGQDVVDEYHGGLLKVVEGNDPLEELKEIGGCCNSGKLKVKNDKDKSARTKIID
tara:strand:- start:25109 stop:25384 length:276 start_codon:yes stop_codon:yes gene_type:complete